MIAAKTVSYTHLKAVFTGAAVALVTPFHKDGSINYGKLEELIDYQIENSTDAIVCLLYTSRCV